MVDHHRHPSSNSLTDMPRGRGYHPSRYTEGSELDVIPMKSMISVHMNHVERRNNKVSPSTDAETCVGRRWTFEYNVPIPEENRDLKDSQVPEHVQELLKVAACLESLDETLVRAALSDHNEDAHRARFEAAAELGLIVVDQNGQHSFLNAETQQAAYGLIDEDDQARFHLAVGRKLARNLSQDELESNVYAVLRQYHRGMDEMSSANEKKAIAALCRRAAQQAVSESNFVASSMYLEFGVRLMGRDPWNNDYELTLNLYNAAAEVEYCLANFDRMDQLVSQVLEEAHCFRDTVLARATRVYSLGGRGRAVEAVKEGLYVLKHLGVSFPAKITKWHVAWEVFKTNKLMRGRTNEMISRIPLMVDSDMISAMQMLNLIFPSVFKTDSYLAFLVSSRMVSLSLEHGLSAISSVGFSTFGTMYCSFTSDKDAGYRFGQLALTLLDRFQAREWLPRVYFSVYGNINRQRHRLEDLIDPLHQAYGIGMETGDIEFAMLNASMHVAFMLFGGQPLPVLEKQALAYISVMETHKQMSALAKTRSILRFVQNLMGKADDPFEIGDDKCDEEVASARAHNLLMTWRYFQKVILRYILADFDGAEREAVAFRSLRKYLHFKSSFGFISLIEGLALLAVCNDRPRNIRKKHLLVVRGNIKQLTKEALLNPRDIVGKQFLLEAELAAVAGKHDRARQKYICAVAVAGDNGIVLDHAIACERAGRYAMRMRDEEAAKDYFRKAHTSYGVWGAQCKVEQLETEMSATFDNDIERPPPGNGTLSWIRVTKDIIGRHSNPI